jgi:tetratricopeptide (TPR) repeat protein
MSKKQKFICLLVTLTFQEDFQCAVASYDRALSLCPARFKEDRAILFQNRGACHARQGKFLAALRDLNRAVELNGMYLKARLKRAQVFEQLGDGDKALEDYNVILGMDPEHEGALEAVERLKK